MMNFVFILMMLTIEDNFNATIGNSSELMEKCVCNITDEPIKKIKIYGVSWNMRFVRPIPIKNLKHFSHYDLMLNNDCFPELEDLFDNYKSCDKYLTAQDTFCSEPRDCVACVKIYFKVKSITIYFRENACYYYKGNWYKPNYDLYYSIFWFFETDAIMPNVVIEKGKKSYEEKSSK